MEEHQNVRPLIGTTEWNHSYYTSNSLSALHSLQQLQDGTSSTSAQPLASTQETNGTAPSGSMSSPQFPHSTISSQVLAGPTRNVTGEVMPLAETVAQLSIFDFLQRCGLLIAPLQPLQLPITISLLDAADASIVLDQCLRYLLTRLCGRLYTASHLTMIPHNYRSRSASSGASSPTTLSTAKLCHRHIAMLAALHRHNLLTVLRFVFPAAPAMPAVVTCTLRHHMSYCSHHRVSRSMLVNMLHMVYLLKRHRCDLVCVQLSQSRTHSHLSVPPVWTHIPCAQLLPSREAQVP